LQVWFSVEARAAYMQGRNIASDPKLDYLPRDAKHHSELDLGSPCGHLMEFLWWLGICFFSHGKGPVRGSFFTNEREAFQPSIEGSAGGGVLGAVGFKDAALAWCRAEYPSGVVGYRIIVES
jgi:hypothetical protein